LELNKIYYVENSFLQSVKSQGKKKYLSTERAVLDETGHSKQTPLSSQGDDDPSRPDARLVLLESEEESHTLQLPT